MKPLVTILVCLMLIAAAVPARGADMLLMEEPRKDFTWYGVLFLGLSVASFAVASNDYKESSDAMKKADSAYSLYKAATTSSDADLYHRKTRKLHRAAAGYESTANAAVLLGVIFGLTGVYSFRNYDHDAPILMSFNRVTVRLRF
jgi:hypothetical protein